MLEGSSRNLPLLQGHQHLGFRCTGCGNCCRSLRVTLTHRDLERLAAASGEPYAALVDWLGPSEVDMSGEPEGFVELAQGRRLMVLAQRDGACRWLDSEQRCRVYAARPADCRAFPFSFEVLEAEAGLSLSLLSGTACDYALDGQQELSQVRDHDQARWRELAEYQALVARWNRLAKHRRMLGHRARGAVDFLDFIARGEAP
ncbi:MAG: YkgJ family cysteine cluster protein [Polyangiaceae bacterium]